MARRIEVEVVGNTKDFEKALDKAGKSGSNFGSNLKKAGLLAGAGIGAVAVGLKKSVDAALESEKAQARLEQAMKGAGLSFDKYGGSINDAIEKTSRLAALDDEDLSDSFAKLVRSTGDVTKATEGMNLAADIARSRNISLETATKAVERALIGNSAAFSRLGVQVVKSSDNLKNAKETIDTWRDSSGKLTEAEKEKAKALLDTAKELDKQATAANAFAKAQEKFAGGAKEYGETAAAAQERFGVALENLQEKIGAKLLPALAKLAEFSLEVIESIEKNWPKIQKAIEPTLDSIQKSIQSFIAWARGAWDKWGDELTTITKVYFGHIAEQVRNTMQIIQGIVDVFAGLLTGDFGRMWDGIKGIFGGAVDSIRNTLETAVTAYGGIATRIGVAIKDGVVNALQGIGNAAWAAISKIGEAIVGGAETIAGWGRQVGTGVKNAAVNAIVGIGEGAWAAISKIGEKVSEMLGTVAGWGTSIGSAIKAAVPESIVGIGVAAWAKINNIWEFVSDRMNTIKGWGTSIGKWVVGGFEAAISGILGVVEAIIAKIKWIIEHMPSLPSIGNNPTDPFKQGDAHVTGGFDLKGASPVMAPFAAAAAAHGLHVTSGLRPGAVTKHGTPSDHAIGKALDLADGPTAMASYFKSLVGNSAVKQAFYDPLGSIFGGKWSSYREGGHSDHVHVATYDRGGWLAPRSKTLAINNTPHWEPVGPPGRGMGQPLVVQFVIDGRTMAEQQYPHILVVDKNNGGRILNHGASTLS